MNFTNVIVKNIKQYIVYSSIYISIRSKILFRDLCLDGKIMKK